MSTRDLREKYGRGRSINARTLVNLAIRAELVGGDDALTALDAAREVVRKFEERGWRRELALARTAVENLEALAAALRAEIRHRYGMPPEEAR